MKSANKYYDLFPALLFSPPAGGKTTLVSLPETTVTTSAGRATCPPDVTALTDRLSLSSPTHSDS